MMKKKKSLNIMKTVMKISKKTYSEALNEPSNRHVGVSKKTHFIIYIQFWGITEVGSFTGRVRL